MASMTFRALVLLVLPTFLASSCATGGGESPELIEAGRRIRREQPPPTAAELRLEVDSFVRNELPLIRKKTERDLARESKGWRLAFAGGAALGLVAATSGSLKSSDGSAKAILVGTGAAVAATAGVVWAVRAPRIAACRAYFDGAERDVASWQAYGIPPGDGAVTPDVWHAWVDRVAAIRAHEGCRR